MRRFLSLALVFAVSSCSTQSDPGAERSTKPDVKKKSLPPDDPTDVEKDSPPPKQTPMAVLTEPLILLGVTFPQGVSAFREEQRPAIEGRRSIIHLLVSSRRVTELVDELRSSIGDSFEEVEAGTRWRASRFEITLFKSDHKRVAYIKDFPKDTRSVIKLLHTPKPTGCPPCRPGEGATLPGCSC